MIINKDEYIKTINLYKTDEITSEEFDNRIKKLTQGLPCPLREFYIINSYLNDELVVPEDKKEFLYPNALLILESNDVSNMDKNKIKCALINAYFSDSNYEKAEKYANNLLYEFSNDIAVLKSLASYYTKTRRYDLAGNLYKIIINLDKNESIKKDHTDFERISNNKKDPYFPKTQESQKKYCDFMKSLNIDVNFTRPKNSTRMIDYPIRKIHLDVDFDSFVAFDIETTGLSHISDSIIELAAIRVVNGKVVEEKEFLFQELVHPDKKNIPRSVERLTGITNEMVKDAKMIWEILPEFVEFIKDDILVGYNCKKFDSWFLYDAGKACNITINNQYYDAENLAEKLSGIINSTNNKLESVSKALGIENPQAHRALADAITTARVYLALKNKVQAITVNAD